MIFRGLLLSGGLFLGGCSWLGWFGKSDEQLILETGVSVPTEIPEGLNKPVFRDQMPIPKVIDYRGLADREIELRLPEPLSTTFGVEKIVIRKLGEARWVFLDLPIATVWPQVVLFWEENLFPIMNVDPKTGTLETKWMNGGSGTPEQIYESLSKGFGRESLLDARKYKFFVRIEPGVRASSTELYIKQIERPLEGFEVDDATEPKVSDNPELEGKMLATLAYYLGDRVAQGPSVSLLAAGLQESKVYLTAEAEGMALKYKLDFNRAWATVGAALEDAKVTVEDIDRSAAVYYVYYSSRHNPDPGFLSRVFGRSDDKDDSGVGHRFIVQLRSEGKEVSVTVGTTGELASLNTDSLILKERLLKLIKEYST